MRERLKSLHLLRQVRKCRCHSRFKLVCRFSVGPLSNLVLASGDQESLFGTKATFLDRGANLIPLPGGRVSKIAGKALSIHETPLSRAVPEWHHFLFEVVPSKTQEIEVVKPEIHHEVAPTLYVPISGCFHNDPAAFHA